MDIVQSPGRRPVADADIGLLPSGGSVLVDVLANDYDPARAASWCCRRPTCPRIRASSLRAVGHSLLRISAHLGLARQARLTYTVSNGAASAEGQITIVPIPPKPNPEPPSPWTTGDRARATS